MAIHRGIQSALFYYLSCAPCTDARARRARKKEADLLRQEKEAQAEAYKSPGAITYPDHPAPSQTNRGWDLEIALGPSRESKAHAKQRKKDVEAAPRSSASTDPSEKGKKGGSVMDSPSDMAAWAQTFQRPDGEYTLHARRSALSSKGRVDLAPLPESSVYATLHPFDGQNEIAKPKPARLGKSATSYSSRSSQANPPLNELHPPTVTKYESKRELSWALEPPPSAKFMGGIKRGRRREIVPVDGSNDMDDTQGYDSAEDISPRHRREQNLSSDDSAPAEDMQDAYDAFEHPRRLTSPDTSSHEYPAPFVFPAKQEPWTRRDSATTGDEEWDEYASDGARIQDPAPKRPNGHATDPRWRWSIDW